MATKSENILNRLQERLAALDTAQVDFLGDTQDVLPPSADQLRQQRISLRESAGLSPAATFREFARPDITAVRPQVPLRFEPEMVPAPRTPLSPRLHTAESQTVVCSLIEERPTWPVCSVLCGGGGGRPHLLPR